MKHAIGGFGLGMITGLFTIENGEQKPAQCFIMVVLVAVACWGLLP